MRVLRLERRNRGSWTESLHAILEDGSEIEGALRVEITPAYDGRPSLAKIVLPATLAIVDVA